jgi:hypothetical protein
MWVKIFEIVLDLYFGNIGPDFAKSPNIQNGDLTIWRFGELEIWRFGDIKIGL